mmetsp:Transcript_85476/g.161039  ORF Transcript_85476/g.161039 Transcript_85476/m.161039 type:complete len:1006 (+) Transcript_85476:73-3090(+)
MAAVIMAMHKNREKGEKDDEEDDGEKRKGSKGSGQGNGDPRSLHGNFSSQEIDENRDGVLSPDEMAKFLPLVSIRADLMLQRLHLEMKMTAMMMKMPIFLTCVICFLIAIGQFSPAASVSNVHKHLTTQFELSKAAGLTSFEGIYTYIETFEKKNEELQASSAKYWCEERYFSVGWNADLLVPYTMCQSPRLHALGVGDTASRLRWTTWNTTGSCGGSAASGSGHRRLRGLDRRLGGDCGSGDDILSSSVSAYESGTKILSEYPDCEDNNTALALAEGDENATCAGYAPGICEVDLGILLCPQTCQYCAPFKYQRIQKFPKPQLTLLPIVVYQTRFPLMECHGFAEEYIKQPVNPVLSVIPALDGLKSDKLIECIDRSKNFKEPFAIEYECDAGHTAFCQPCSFHENKSCFADTPKSDFHGLTVYPKVILEPHHDVMRMKSMNWLDLQTDAVSLSTVVYTEGSEIFTSLTVEFSTDEAGNIIEHHRLISYRDLTKGAKTTFIACLITCSVGAFIGVCISVYALAQTKPSLFQVFFKQGLQAYELFSRLVLFVYPLVLLLSWMVQTPMAEEYMKLLMAFLEAKSLDAQSQSEVLRKYFEAKTHIYEETSWLKQHRVVANIVLYVQFLQLIFYFSVHPKMAMLTDTIGKALTNIVHFLILFATLFFMLAFMAHWQLGEFITNFATFGDTVSAQGRMIFGEFIYASGAERLHGVMMFMYWLYAFTFLLIMWGLLLNFFLAIVVDAFADINSKNNDSEVVGNFLGDCFDVCKSFLDGIKYGWPLRSELFEFFMFVELRAKQRETWFSQLEDEGIALEGHEHDPHPTCIPEELGDAFKTEFRHPHPYLMAVFVTHYFKKIPKLLRRRVPEMMRHQGPPQIFVQGPPQGVKEAYPSTPVKPMMAPTQMTPATVTPNYAAGAALVAVGSPSPPKEPRSPVEAPMLAPSPLPGAVQETAAGISPLRDAAGNPMEAPPPEDLRAQIAQVLNLNMELVRHNQEIEARRAEMEEWC